MKAGVDNPTHTIREVSERTGLSLDVIRVWERRYKAVVPERIESGRRLYSDAQISRLVMLRRATEQGLRIGDAARADDGDLKRFISKHEASNSAARIAERAQRAAACAHLQACMQAVRETDPVNLDDALGRARIVLSTNILLEEVLGPLMTWIGGEWSSGRLRVAQEQMASAALRRFLAEHTRYNESHDPGRPVIVVATPAGQVHELGALMVGMACAAKGWRVDYLGRNVAAEEIAGHVRRTGPQLVALSIVHPEADPATAQELRKIRRGLGPDPLIVIGGRAAPGYADAIDEIGAIHCESVSDLGESLDGLASTAPHGDPLPAKPLFNREVARH
jgi:methanogenic corrinoid protein MtbC1